MNLKLRRIVGVGVLIVPLIISQFWMPLSWACMASVVTTVALCVASIVILRRKGWLEMKTQNPAMRPAFIPLWIASMSGVFYQQATRLGRAQNQPFLQDLAWRFASIIQWICAFTLVSLAVLLVHSFWMKRRSSS